MFKVKLENAGTFKRCIDALNTLIDEGKFIINEKGMTLTAMSPSQIAMVDFKIPKTAFSEYDVDGENEVGINLNDLNDRTRRSRSGDSLEISLGESDSRLKLVFKGKIKRTFDLPLLDLTEDTPNEPAVDFNSELKINGTIFKENLKDANLVSSHVVLKLAPQKFEIKAKGDKGTLHTEIDKEDDVILDYKSNEEQRAMFPLEYMNNLLTGVSSDSIVTLNLKNDAPLKLKYGIGNTTLTYYLAPRVEEQ